MDWLERPRPWDRLVTISVAADLLSPGRFEMSAGTREPTREEAHGRFHYEDGARVPGEPWRPLTEAELDLLITHVPPQDYGLTVALVRLPGATAAERENVRLGDVDSIERHIFAPLLDICDIGEPITLIGAHSNSSGCLTTTIEPTTGAGIGLHIDSWERSPATNRTEALNRISVNIGEAERFFLFLPVSLAEIERLPKADLDADMISAEDVTGLARLFMKRFPWLPVVRCRLSPYEAYIAPTENLVHDGSSLGQTATDDHYTILGRITLLSL